MLTPPNIKRRAYKADAERWLSPEDIEYLRRVNPDGRVRFVFSKPERLAWRRHKRIPPSEWAPKNRYVTDGDFAGKPMNLRVAPYTAGIMDAAVLPFVRQVTICAAPQTSKTFTINTILAWLSKFAPGPVLSAYPKEEAAKKNLKDKILGMYKQSPALKYLLTGRRGDITDTVMRMMTFIWRVGWAGSAVSLADWASKYIDGQEVDKYPARPNEKEAGVIELLRHRSRWYPNSYKHFWTSTPTVEEGNIWKLLIKETAAVFIFWVRCPVCAGEQCMEFERDRFWWPKDESGRSVDRKEILGKKLARYQCDACGAKWTDTDRNKAVLYGRWRLADLIDDKDGGSEKWHTGEKGPEMFAYLRQERPGSIGFHMASWISSMVPLSEVAHDFLRCRDKALSPGDRFMAYQDFQNKHKALPWRIEQTSRPVTEVLKYRDDRPGGMVPGGGRAATLLYGVDTQDNGFYYLIMAFGWGFSAEQWLVRAGYVTSWAALKQVLWEDEYRDNEGNRYIVEFGLQDMLGHRTKEVVEFCWQYQGMIAPAFGKDTMTEPFTLSRKEYWPATGQPIPGGGMRAVRVNTKYFKDNMAARLRVDPEDPGAVHLHKDIGEDFARQWLSEAPNDKGIWEQIGNRDNHYWDCWCLANCAAEVIGLKYRCRPDEENDDDDELEIVDGVME